MRWIGVKENETLHTIRQDLVSVATVEALQVVCDSNDSLYSASFQPAGGNEYMCVVTNNGELVDSVSVTVTVPRGAEGQSWKDRIHSTKPAKGTNNNVKRIGSALFSVYLRQPEDFRRLERLDTCKLTMVSLPAKVLVATQPGRHLDLCPLFVPEELADNPILSGRNRLGGGVGGTLGLSRLLHHVGLLLFKPHRDLPVR